MKNITRDISAKPLKQERALRMRIYLDHRPALISYATPIVGCAAAEDVVQEAYFRFVSTSDHNADVQTPVAYLFRIVRNIALDFTRRKGSELRKVEQFAQTIDKQAHAPAAEQQSEYREMLALIEHTLDQLPDDVRTAFILKRLHGASYQQIGEHLCVSKATAHRLAQKALLHIMQAMQAQGLSSFP